MRRNNLRLALKMLLSATVLTSASLSALRTAWADIDDGKAANNGQLPLPSGQYITPTLLTGAQLQLLNPGLPNYPNYVAGEAVKTALSPDGNTLLVMTTGYNKLNGPDGKSDPSAGNEYIFIFDVAGENRARPVQKQVIQISNAYVGLVWAPSGEAFYAAGGQSDNVSVFGKTNTRWGLTTAIDLGHGGKGIGINVLPNAAGLGISADGSVLVVANMYNDSISVIDTASNAVRFEYDLRPFNTSGLDGVAGGEYPFTVAVADNGTAYVSSIRDREIVVVDISGTTGNLVTRIPVEGSPNSLILNKAQTQLLATTDNSDQVVIIDTATKKVAEVIDTIAPPGTLAGTTRYTGAGPNNLTLSPDEATLYVVNGGANSIGVIPMNGSSPHVVSGLIPTGWYPHSVSLSADGSTMYFVNGKSDPGRNDAHLTSATPNLTKITYAGGNAAASAASNAANQYVMQLHQASLVSAPVPAATDLSMLTRQVAANNGYNLAANASDDKIMASLRSKIKHVIYVVKENRSYDQMLGDLENGANGDPKLTVFGRRVTPNQHRIARKFVTLDNFFDSGDTSIDGWSWSTQARITDVAGINAYVNYGRGGVSYDTEGQNRGVAVGQGDLAAREAALPGFSAAVGGEKGGAANVLPDVYNVGATDSPTQAQGGYLWDSVLRAGLTVRNYGFLVDLSRYFVAPTSPVFVSPSIRSPFAEGKQVAFPTIPSLIPLTDIYYRGYDNAAPDLWRLEEWKREFDKFVADGNLPSLSLVRLPHDHMGQFATAVGGFNTPETQQADNDLALGRLVEYVAHSRYASDTLIFVIEDDCQDGPDHMDAHRSTAYVVGPYVKQDAVVSTRYTTINVFRTIEDVLGIEHLNLNDAYQRPMADAFDLNQSGWSYNSVASPLLKDTDFAKVDGTGQPVQFADGPDLKPVHDAAYWEEKTRGFDFTGADRVPSLLYRQIIWEGMTNSAPLPIRTGVIMRNGKITDSHPSGN